WERSWLRNPQEMKPDTFMPNFHMPAAAADHIAEYLHTFRGQANEDARAWELRINFMVNNNDVRRGEMIWKRLACWSCHGEEGRGGVQNPNAAAGHEQIPDLRSVRDTETMEEFGARLAAGRTVPAVGADAVPQPFPCPKYEGALDEQELSDLYAYVSSLAPPKLRWKIK
ncbi:MAG: c-type cytochrome, partial [Acidobacteriota bacterium]